MKSLWSALKKAGTDFFEDDCMSAGAALAYYTIFSLPPLLVIVFLVASAFGVSEDTINSVVKRQLGIPVTEAVGHSPSGESGEENEKNDTQSSRETPSEDQESSSAQASTPGFGNLGLLSRLIGIGILIFSATGVFAQLQFALNRAWEVEPDPEAGGVWNFLFKRFLSLGMVVVIAFLLLVSLVLTTLIDEAVHLIQGGTPDMIMQVVGFVLNDLVTLLLATLLFAAMYKILPDAEMAWKDVWVGAAFTGFLFVVGRSLIGWYLQNSQLGSEWGSAAASMVAVLVWVYYSSLLVLFGAELTQVWANQFGSGIRPSNGAVRKVEEKHLIREPDSGAQPKPA